ncbi:MAG TPA: hypothetical protein VLF94_07065 [Chlamydiales bacterium]|nr:hypothetical protein [Chlamydiales bacterium]
MHSKLQALCPLPLQITWHENKSTYLTIYKQRHSLHLRLHRLFYDAPTPVLEALIRYALKKGDTAARAIVKQMAHLHFSQTHTPPEPLSPIGSIYHLQEIFDRINQTLALTDVTIGWSNRAHNGKFRSVTFGTYDKHGRQIRINPLLDDPDVPLYFVEFIVYHEMLHAVYPTKIDMQGRCAVHTAEFRKREKQFPRYREAMEWEKTSLMFFKKRSCGRS